MAKFKVGDKVRLKKGLETGKEYGKIPLMFGMKDNMEADGGIHTIKKVNEMNTINVYLLDTEYPYYYSEEMLELAEEKEEKTKKDFDDFQEALTLMAQLERIMKRLNEITKSNEGE